MSLVDVQSGERMHLTLDSRVGNESVGIDEFYKKNDIWVRRGIIASDAAINHSVQISTKATEREMLRELSMDIF